MNWRVWLLGAVSALISGIGNAIAVSFVVPESLSWDRFGLVALFGAIIGLSNYIKQSPLPVKTATAAMAFVVSLGTLAGFF